MKKASALLWAVLLSLTCLVFARVSDAGTSLIIATGGEAGVYYPLGKGIAKVLTERLTDTEVTAEISDASVANIRMIAAHEAALALVQNDMAFRAARGEKPFREPVRNLSMIASLYPEYVQCVTVSGNGVRTISDLRGRRVSVGTTDPGALDSVGAILSAAGLRYAEINADFHNFTDTALRIQDDQLDAGFVLAGYPTPAVAELAARMDINIAAFEKELLDKLTAAYPYFMRGIIPAGTYKGIDHDVPTVSVMAVLVCDSDLPEDLVYDITKAIFENLEEIAPIHAKARMISLGSALFAATVNVHPGAAKYYAEKGFKIPTLRR
ncbi:MAG: TAXI family TRAP transporter solute-binding subunit [Synergistaceae bacterium]|nr:TAXI family TRAP transporter solute-binding subunit [Synergistaceae bacterium]